MTLIARLKSRVLTPSGKPKCGAVQRISEHLQVSSQTVRNWLDGTWSPGKATLARIEDMLKSGVDLGPRKRGPKPGRKKNLLQMQELACAPKTVGR